MLRTTASGSPDQAGRSAPNTNRTCDLPLRRGLLYPLSYRGVRGDSTEVGNSASGLGYLDTERGAGIVAATCCQSETDLTQVKKVTA